MSITEKMDNILNSCSIKELIIITVLLSFATGLFIGSIIEKYNIENQIQNNLEQTAQQYNNFLRINDKAYQITEIEVSNCFPYKMPIKCTITNLRTFEQFNVYVNGTKHSFTSQYANGYSDGFNNGTEYMRTHYEKNILPWTISTDSDEYQEYQKYIRQKGD